MAAGRRPETRRFFRGSELPRLAILLALTVAGWVYIVAGGFRTDPPPPPPRRVASLPPLPPADDAPELQGIQDRTAMNARDNAAYKLLLDRLRAMPYAELAAASRRDIRFSQLFDAPQRYRGLPIHIEGLVRRVLIQRVEGSRLFPPGQYYEAWAFTPESMAFPYVLAFEQAPTNLAIGDNIEQRVEFDGYFLKLLAYRDGSGEYRAAPMLVGRFPPAPVGADRGEPAPKPGGGWVDALRRVPATTWLLAVVSLYALFRVVTTVFRIQSGRGRLSRAPRPRLVNDQIDPEVLSAWVEKVEEDDPDD